MQRCRQMTVKIVTPCSVLHVAPTEVGACWSALFQVFSNVASTSACEHTHTHTHTHTVQCNSGPSSTYYT